MRLILPALFLSSLPLAPAAASSAAAWAAGNAAARDACRRAAGLAGTRASAPILFSDAAGKTAFLVRGQYRQPALKGQPGEMLCLYDRRTRRAETSEARGWSAP